jgi:5-methylthioadenosine/S-adenosylhomocysteine deaminase
VGDNARMQPADLLISARWIIPVEPRQQVLEHHAVVISDGLIKAVLPRDEALHHYQPALVLERPEHLLIPGLVNAHTHAAMSLFRGLADDVPLEPWLTKHIWPAEGRWVSPEFVKDGTDLAILEMLLGGTTCFSDMYFFPDVAARVAAERQMRASIGMIVLKFPTVWAQDMEGYFSKGLALHDQYRGHPLVSTYFAPHAPYTVTDEAFRRIRMLSDELDVPVHSHVAETAAEVTDSLREHGLRPLARLEQLGLVGSQLAAIHVTQINESEIAVLSERGAHVIHCPESNLKLASGFCPVAGLQQAGINVALGTDGAASNNDLDMFSEMRTAALLGKGIAGDASALPAATVLEMATLGGARALGLGHHIGSLIPGKAADVVCLDLSGASTQPVHNPLSTVIYAAGRDNVTDVWVAGRHLVAGRQTTHMDPGDVLERAGRWAERLQAGS